MDENLVTCIIPTFKRNDTLIRAINSVLSQTYKNIEVLVVDDNEKGSKYSLSVQKIISDINDRRVRYIPQIKHINGAEARNEGIRQSNGNFIAFLDDDDEWLPTKIERQLDFFSFNDDCSGVSCFYNEYKNNVLVHSCPPYTKDNLHKKIFQREVAVFTSTILLKKDALIEAGFFDHTLKRHQDLQLLLDFTKNHKLYVLNEYLVKLHLDSDINRPSYDKLVDYKRDFFKSVADHLNNYSKKEQRLIISAHRFELAFSALKERKIISAVKQLIKVGINISAYKLFLKRIKGRKYVANKNKNS